MPFVSTISNTSLRTPHGRMGFLRLPGGNWRPRSCPPYWLGCRLEPEGEGARSEPSAQGERDGSRAALGVQSASPGSESFLIRERIHQREYMVLNLRMIFPFLTTLRHYSL